MLPKKITICEVGPRDGLQNEKIILSVEDKLQLIESAVASGITNIEIGSFVHPKAVPQMADTDEVAKRLSQYSQVEYRALISNARGVERAIAAGVKKVKLTVSSSESHNLKNWNKSTQDVIKGFADCLDLANKNGVEVSGAISTAFGCPFEGAIPMRQVIDIIYAFEQIGINELSLSDTTGMAYPTQVYEMSITVQKLFPKIEWWLHLHNTRGLALANIMAGMQAGITRYDASFAGLGGCPFAPGASGNVATEDVVHMCDLLGVDTGIDLDKLIEVGKLVRQMVGHDTESFILKAGKSQALIRS